MPHYTLPVYPAIAMLASKALLEGYPALREKAGKLVWGSDMPNVERFCTYGQSLEYLRRYCDFLPASDMDRILGDNAARLYRISAA